MRIILIITGLLISYFIYGGQTKIDGFYINNNSDTVKCKFKVLIGSDYTSEQYKIGLITSANNFKILIPDTVSEIVVGSKKFVSFKNDFDLSGRYPFIFMELILDGYVKLFAINNNRSDYNGRYSSGILRNTYYVQKGDSSLIEVEENNKKFRDQMCRLFSGDDKLVNKIKNDDYGPSDKFTLIKEYNESMINCFKNFNDTNIYSFPDVEPLFLGKELTDLNFYFKTRIKWPSDVGRKEKIAIHGIVNKDGTFNIITLDGFITKQDMNQQFLEVAKSMHKWTPGRYNGFTVRSFVTFTIKYK